MRRGQSQDAWVVSVICLGVVFVGHALLGDAFVSPPSAGVQASGATRTAADQFLGRSPVAQPAPAAAVGQSAVAACAVAFLALAFRATARSQIRKGGAVRRATSFPTLEKPPADPILGVAEQFRNDTEKGKVNLGVGAYRDDSGKPWVLPSVKKAVEEVTKEIDSGKTDMEYLPIDGHAPLVAEAAKLIYGEKLAGKWHVAGTQTISGTGALRIGASFLRRLVIPESKPARVFVPGPTWPNHVPIFQQEGFEVSKYRYFDNKTMDVDFKGMLADVKDAPEGSVFVFHVCAHNPTGSDLTNDQWKELAALVKEKGHITFFDSAYQGFATGDLDNDAFSVRCFLETGVVDKAPLLVAQSFAKNLGLYGQRTGVLSVPCKSEDDKKLVSANLKVKCVRPAYSSPPKFGALVAAKVLGNPELRKQWQGELDLMSGRILDMRKKLTELLEERGVPMPHIMKQIGMFAMLTLPKGASQAKELRDKHHIYLTDDGRISVAGLNTGNVERVADAVAKVIKA